jgi:ABC-type multidrug transport system permease subunit
MRRLWILFKTEFSVWKHDPITALGGVIPCLIIFLAFSLLFGGRLSFKIAVINNDQGEYGQRLVGTFKKAISPLDNAPYYAVQKMDEEQAWEAFKEYRVDGIWLIPEDFSSRIAAGDHPEFDMYFMNYNDDRAKNHRIYSTEVLWQFYETIGQPAPPLARAETYPLPVMIDWVSIISIGIVLLSVTLGGIFNMFILTYKAQTGKITLEFGLSPRSLGWVLFPKAVLALLFGLVTGTLFLVIIRIFLGYWPGGHIWAVYLLAGLVAVFWIQVALVAGFLARSYMSGAVGSVLSAMIIFFIGGGLSMVRANTDSITWIAWLFPNVYAVDPIRDLVLFNTWPVDFWPVLVKLLFFAGAAVLIGSAFTVRKLRRLG